MIIGMVNDATTCSFWFDLLMFSNITYIKSEKAVNPLLPKCMGGQVKN
jgi:hypothetical protein